MARPDLNVTLRQMLTYACEAIKMAERTARGDGALSRVSGVVGGVEQLPQPAYIAGIGMLSLTATGV